MTIKTVTQGEAIVKLQTDVSYIKTDVSEVKSTMKAFIESADTKYASRKEVDDIKSDIKSYRVTSRGWVQTIVPWIFTALSLLTTWYVVIVK